ncbi:hypothetical protein Tco_0789911 [Tanacetum coccineum]
MVAANTKRTLWLSRNHTHPFGAAGGGTAVEEMGSGGGGVRVAVAVALVGMSRGGFAVERVAWVMVCRGGDDDGGGDVGCPGFVFIRVNRDNSGDDDGGGDVGWLRNLAGGGRRWRQKRWRGGRKCVC